MTARGWWRDADRDDRRRLALAVLLGTAATLASPALLALSGFLLARAAQAPPILTLGAAIVGVRFFGLLRAAARYAERLVGHDLALGRLGRERVALFEALTPHVPGRLGTRTSADVLDGLVADVDRLADLPVRVVVPACSIALAAGACVLAATLLLPAAGPVLAAALGLQALLLAVPAGRAAALDADARAAARAALQQELVTTLDASAELVAWGAAGRQTTRVAAAGARVDALAGRAARLASGGTATTIAAGAWTLAALLAVALPAAADGRLDGVLVAALALLGLGATEVLGGLPDVLVARREVATAAQRLAALVPDAPPRTGDEHPADGSVHVRDLRLSRGGRTILDGVDLDVAAGERVALTGPSGCGKSTLVDVLLGFVDPDPASGAVTVGGADVTRADGAALRRTVRWAPQDPHVFPTTIAANVRVAAPDADDATVEAALRAVGAGPWLDRLPRGIHTRLGELGEHASGGERQRIGLARALLGGGRLVVLDEPASQLPRADALAALTAVADADPTRGVLLVTHRPEELALADREVHLTPGG
ncbi:thiol reductant ABC exporter subunit CydC [Paraconexibacter algicola]|uniref:Thiol reductant ABC exporter subunit CydC n=1 Tax=Paraconexibacter algicola TaxID=2133960 RepID=A0A2T4UDG9_9ACTN|nr:thiol reductant ABC exporter subunit CydC [Paraconexibacter algicola]PTL55553.1 thiol reductant ABC exporter subunit CydC [Paraconexibacter algicola]